MEKASFGLIERASGVPKGLLVCYHGLGGSPQQLADNSKLGELASPLGIDVVFAQSLWRFWRFWRTEGNWHANRDLATFDDALRSVPDPLWRGKVFVFGFSAGADFVQVLAATRGPLIDGLISYAGQAKSLPDSLRLKQGIVPPALFVNNNGDRAVPMENAEALHRAWPAPSSVRIIEGPSHFIVPAGIAAAQEQLKVWLA